MAKKGEVKECLLQTVSVTTQIDILRKVSRFKLQVRDSQLAGRSRGAHVFVARLGYLTIDHAPHRSYSYKRHLRQWALITLFPHRRGHDRLTPIAWR